MILSQIEGSRFSEVRPEWSGAKVALIGGGPSLTAEQVARVKAAHDARAIRCIAINDAYLLAPWADVHYAADAHWHRWHSDGIAMPLLGLGAATVARRWLEFSGEKCSIEGTGCDNIDWAVHLLKKAHGSRHGFGLSSDPRALVTGWNSGFQALNLAILAGAKTVILLGYDGRPGADGKTHWFGDHPQPTNPAAYKLYQQAMSYAERDIEAAGVRVINCSPGSAIDSFVKMKLEDVL